MRQERSKVADEDRMRGYVIDNGAASVGRFAGKKARRSQGKRIVWMDFFGRQEPDARGSEFLVELQSF